MQPKGVQRLNRMGSGRQGGRSRSRQVGQAALLDGVAGVQVGGAGIELELRHLGAAALVGERAARMEGAAGGGASGEGSSPLTAMRLERWRGSVDGLLAWSARV